jgi:AraC family transcriptional activator of pobA
MNTSRMSALDGPHTDDLKLKGVKVYEIDTSDHPIPVYNRRDFYKICLLNGKSDINYADRGIVVDGDYLFFGNPFIPYSSELLSPAITGYGCLFTDDFLNTNDRSESLQESPLFKIGGNPVILLNDEQKQFLTGIYQRMLAEQQIDYVYKGELIRNYINLIIHEALKMQPPDTFIKHNNAASRITALFLDLLERQFPIDDLQHPLKLRTAQEYALQLSVHVNHLNRVVKNTTSKSTSDHIAERIISEAKALLLHKDWNIADVAFALGFEYPTHFNGYFKRITGITPRAYRQETDG